MAIVFGSGSARRRIAALSRERAHLSTHFSWIYLVRSHRIIALLRVVITGFRQLTPPPPPPQWILQSKF